MLAPAEIPQHFFLEKIQNFHRILRKKQKVVTNTKRKQKIFDFLENFGFFIEKFSYF